MTKVHTELRLALRDSDTVIDIPIDLPYEDALARFRVHGIMGLMDDTQTIVSKHKSGRRIAARLEGPEVAFAALLEIDDDA